MRRAPRLLVALAALATAAHAEVPLSRAKTGHLTVPVSIGGAAPVELVLDTGAEGTAVYAAFAASLRLKPLAGRGDTLVGQTGETRTELVLLPGLAIDGRKLPPLEAVVLPDRADGVPLAGILGADALGRFLVVIDFAGGRVSLHPEGSDAAALAGPGAASLALAFDEARIGHLTVTVQGQPVEAVLDTGARKTRINWKLARLLGLEPGSAALRDAETIQGATNDPVATKEGAIGDVAIGSYRVRDARALVVDLPVFATFHVADRPAMILGADLLDDARILVDYRRQRLWIERVAAATP